MRTLRTLRMLERLYCGGLVVTLHSLVASSSSEVSRIQIFAVDGPLGRHLDGIACWARHRDQRRKFRLSSVPVLG